MCTKLKLLWRTQFAFKISKKTCILLMQVSCSVNSYDRPQYWCHPNLQMITVDIKTDVSICVKVAVVWASSAESSLLLLTSCKKSIVYSVLTQLIIETCILLQLNLTTSIVSTPSIKTRWTEEWRMQLYGGTIHHTGTSYELLNIHNFFRPRCLKSFLR